MKAGFLLESGACFLLLWLWWVGPADATDNYVYKAGEYVTISGGQSPDGRWSIASHGGGEYGYDGFDLYLMREPTHKRAASLRVGGHLDTAPLSNVALWSPDSGYVVVLYRIDRRVLEVQLFAVANGKVRFIQIPALVNIIGKGRFRSGVRHEAASRLYRVAWQNSDRFTLDEFDSLEAAEPVFRPGLETYVQVNRWNTQRTFTDFSASTVCEIAKGGKLRLLGTKPLPKEVKTIVYSPHLIYDPQLGLHTTETTMSSLQEQQSQR